MTWFILSRCIPGAYSIPSQATKIDVGVDDGNDDGGSTDTDAGTDADGKPSGGNNTVPETGASDVLDIGANNNPIVINMNLEPGRFVSLGFLKYKGPLSCRVLWHYR